MMFSFFRDQSNTCIRGSSKPAAAKLRPWWSEQLHPVDVHDRTIMALNASTYNYEFPWSLTVSEPSHVNLDNWPSPPFCIDSWEPGHEEVGLGSNPLAFKLAQGTSGAT